LAATEQPELVFVVDVSSLTGKGFIGKTKYEGTEAEVEFDEEGAGVFLSSEMAGRLHVKKGSPLTVVVEDSVNQLAETRMGGVGKVLRISDPKVYYAIGREGGAIIRLRKG